MMMRKITSATAMTSAVAAAALFGSPAAATPIDQIRTIAELGSCMYISHKSAALELLNTASTSQSDEALQRLKDEKTCFAHIPSESNLDTYVAAYSKGLMRGMIAEAAIRSSSAAAGLRPLPLQQKRYVRPWFAATGRDPSVDEMSACIADTNPGGILALVGTLPNSAEESWAIGDLSPSLQRCLAAGTRLHADRTALRAALADALYQRVRDAAVACRARSSRDSQMSVAAILVRCHHRGRAGRDAGLCPCKLAPEGR